MLVGHQPLLLAPAVVLHHLPLVSPVSDLVAVGAADLVAVGAAEYVLVVAPAAGGYHHL